MTGRSGLRPRILSGALVVMALAACGKTGPPERAAVVAGRPIASVDVERLTRLWMHSQLRQDAEAHAQRVAQSQSGEQASQAANGEQLDRREVARLVLAYLIRRSVLESLATQHGVPIDTDPQGAAAGGAPPEEQLAAAGWGRAEIEGSFEAGRLSRALAERLFPDVAVPESEMRKRFDERPLVFGRSWRVKVLSASFGGPAPVNDLQDAVHHGEPFPEAAKRLGATDNLDLGTVNSIRPLPEPIRAALGSLQPGAVSPSIAAPQGSLALYVVSREDLPALSFAEAASALRTTLTDEKRQDLFGGWFDEQLRSASVTVDHHYGRWDGGQVL